MFLFALIHSGNIHTAHAKKVIPKETFSQLMEAKEIVERAQKEREDLLEQTKQECEELTKQAEAQGFQKGLELFNEQILSLEDRLKVHRHEMQSQILPLALKASQRIIGEELKTNPDTIVNIIQQAIRPITAHKQVKIYVSKVDYNQVFSKKQTLADRFEHLESFRIEPRADIDEGSCVIESEVGIINATLENQWRALEAAFEAYTKKMSKK